ncbi:tryptophan--tRNA ligase [Parasphaerochaeta coccoides]|uniref:Tryptophan--tRNA ligase n=1 Tax=Parasphaerochaeta coccoides (strain ATCC BAA-1237 / DSM 17374 / SPN1) TaxID=760011 RepID=F4GHJ2_PARC1|nr:tryptophan--tRNA ligase [Parasphaerochaeta coccoides]AEC02581.1 tryptophanyl-tRNA synthetase [Parasphaerochaeta coccoides DSM 17374]
MKTMLSGIKPSGQLHLGSYIGAIKQFVTYQEDYHMFVFIANLHCITLPITPAELTDNLRDCLAFYLACGLDPERSTIFLQTDVKEHAQLGFILSCQTYLGELNRMTQYKDKAQGKNRNDVLTAGFYTYPTLMAADILLYNADYVPVGDDQKQHVELTRDIAERVNKRFGQIFSVPEPVITKVGARIMALDNPAKKMSKSEHNTKGTIFLKDEPAAIRKKVMSAVTDMVNKVSYDPVNQPGISNLLTIYAALEGITPQEAEAKFSSLQYGAFKSAVADRIIEEFAPIQARYREIVGSGDLDRILAKGAEKARPIAAGTLKTIQKAIGLDIF